MNRNDAEAVIKNTIEYANNEIKIIKKRSRRIVITTLVSSITIIVLLIGIILVDNTEPKYEGPNYVEKQIVVGNNYSDIDGISILASDMYIYPDKTTIVIHWENDTEFSAIYGDRYSVERLENDQWVVFLLDDTDLTDIDYELRAKESDSKEYILLNTNEAIKAGKYRFLSTCFVGEGEEQSTECSVWIEFIIE